MNCPLCTRSLSNNISFSPFLEYYCNFCGKFELFFYKKIMQKALFITNKYTLSIFFVTKQSFISSITGNELACIQGICVLDTSLDLNSQIEELLLLS